MENDKSSAKGYLIGAVVLIILIVIAVLVFGGSKPAEQNTQATTTVSTTEVNTAAGSEVATAVPTPSDSQGFVGTWVSAQKGKGLEGSGKVTTSRTSTEITVASDVKLVIQKIENGMAIGTLSYSNLCYVIATSISGRPAVAKPAQCTNTKEAAARLKVSGDTISYKGQTELSSDVSFEGSLSGNTLTGTFTRTGTYGKVNGTLNLIRAN